MDVQSKSDDPSSTQTPSPIDFGSQIEESCKVHRRVWLRDVINLPPIISGNSNRDYFMFGSPQCALRCIKTLGVVIGVKIPGVFYLDDSTGIIEVTLVKTIPKIDQKDFRTAVNEGLVLSCAFRAGDLVDCIGELYHNQERKINVLYCYGAYKREDPAYEIMRTLDTIDLYKNTYFSLHFAYIDNNTTGNNNNNQTNNAISPPKRQKKENSALQDTLLQFISDNPGVTIKDIQGKTGERLSDIQATLANLTSSFLIYEKDSKYFLL